MPTRTSPPLFAAAAAIVVAGVVSLGLGSWAANVSSAPVTPPAASHASGR